MSLGHNNPNVNVNVPPPPAGLAPLPLGGPPLSNANPNQMNMNMGVRRPPHPGYGQQFGNINLARPPSAMPNGLVMDLSESPLDANDFPALGSNRMPRVHNLGGGAGKSSRHFTLDSEDFPALPGGDDPSPIQGSMGQIGGVPSNANRKFNDNNGVGIGGGGVIGNPNVINNKQQNQGNFSRPPHLQQQLQNNTNQGNMPGHDNPNPNPNPNGKLNQMEDFNNFSSMMGPNQQQFSSSSVLLKEDAFGMYGLLSAIRMSDQNLNTLALGLDLTTLGLNLNSSDLLYNTFSSPWSNTHARAHDCDFQLPNGYYTAQSSLSPATMKMSLFREENLFYIFYGMPRDLLQQAVASELYNRDWRYHKELQIWFTRMSNTEPIQKTTTFERGTYAYWDVNSWQRQIKKDFTLVYEMLEEKHTAASV